MSTGFSFGSNTASTASTGGFKLGGASTGSGFSFANTPLKTGAAASTSAVASPLASSLSTGANNASPFKLGGLGTTTTTTAATNPLGGGLTASTNPLGGGLNTTNSLSGGSTNPLGGGSTNLLGGGLKLGAAGTTTTNPAASTTATTTTANQQQTTNSTLTFKILEDYVNKWMSDLDSQEKDFLNQATQLNALDKLMVENGEKIVDLSGEVDRLNSEQDQLDQELNFLYSQQSDLEGSIKKLEQSIEGMPTIPQQHCDTSRIEMYKLLIEVDNQLRSQSGDLKDVIKRLNCTNINLNDPVMQINKILNAHMDSLNWIEENTGAIQNQVENVSKTVNDRLRESENQAAKYTF